MELWKGRERAGTRPAHTLIDNPPVDIQGGVERMVESDDKVGFGSGGRGGCGRNVFVFEVDYLVLGGAGGSQVDHGA